VTPEDAATLADAVLRLAKSPSERGRLGKKGRAYALAHWGAGKILNEFQQCLNNLQ
jgi:glycosyltransferase involved in cell wall biosynthesis